MLKKTASFVLGSSKSSTYQLRFSEGEVLEGSFRSQDRLYGRTAPRSAVGTSSGFDSPVALLDGLFEHPVYGSPTFHLSRLTFHGS